MYYHILETLTPVSAEACRAARIPYVAVLTPEEWASDKDSFEMGIDMDLDIDNLYITKAEVNYDSLTGSFHIPDRTHINGEHHGFAFALDERGIVFIDSDGYALEIIRRIQQKKRWKIPSLERFLYDFLEQTISGDLTLLAQYEAIMNGIEAAILLERPEDSNMQINDIRGELLDLRTHYEQLIDLGQELAENENSFFKEENLRYFHLFTSRVERLLDIVASLREYTVQIRDLYKAQLDIKQNRIMTILTVVTSIFLPLTLIVGWYGMNFRYMPELESPLGYPSVMLACILIVAGCLWFFRKKKWL